jgi:hypothetical protein
MNSSEREGERGFLIFVFTIVTSEKKNKGRIIGFLSFIGDPISYFL